MTNASEWSHPLAATRSWKTRWQNVTEKKTGCFGSTCTVEIVILLVMCGGCTVVPVDLHVIHVRLQIQRWVHIEHKSPSRPAQPYTAREPTSWIVKECT